jgi:surface antigen
MISGSVTRILALAGLCAALGGCGSLSATQLSDTGYDLTHIPRPAAHATADADLPFPGDEDTNGANTPSTIEGTALQCVPYAREHSGVNIHGDAYTWWEKAAGVYARGDTPIVGNVMVLNGYAGKHRAHVAVVRRIVSNRKILIDHANWLDDGAVYVNDPVIDVSDNNDWTVVKVWNIRSGSWGTKSYKVQGFISPNPADGPAVIASANIPSLADPIARQIAATNDDLDLNGDDH